MYVCPVGAVGAVQVVSRQPPPGVPSPLARAPPTRKPLNRPGVQARRPRAAQPRPTTQPTALASQPRPPLFPGRPLASPPCWSGPGQGWPGGPSPKATRPQGAPLMRTVEARHWPRSGRPNGNHTRWERLSTPRNAHVLSVLTDKTCASSTRSPGERTHVSEPP